LRAERANRGSWKSRVTGLEDFGLGGEPNQEQRRRRDQRNRTANDDDDLEFKLAFDASKNVAEADAARRAKSSHRADNDDDLAKAIRLSKEEEELRKRQLEDQQQENLLFDDTPSQAPQPTGFNQGYQQQAQVDWFGNPVQSQPTGYYDNAYSQPTGMQPQQTGFQNGYGGGFGYQQPQQTGFEQMQQPQSQFLQPQNTYNPWAQQMNGIQQQQQPIQEQPTAQPGSNNPWANTNSTQSPIGVQPTGSNNPFSTQAPQRQTASPFKQPTLNTLREEQATNQFQSRPNPIQNYAAPIQQQQTAVPVQQQQAQKPQDPYAAKLNSLLASGEGLDTFGNTGDLRIPAQHTAPGTFINSAGQGSMGRLEAARTGSNPFYSQAPQQFPAQTGPAGNFGGNNPFGARPAQQQQQPGQGGSLIDL